MVLAEYAKGIVLFEAEGYRPPIIAKMLESDGAGVFSFAWTSRSLRFSGRLNATSGGLGRACFSLEEVWRIGRCFFTILARVVRLG